MGGWRLGLKVYALGERFGVWFREGGRGARDHICRTGLKNPSFTVLVLWGLGLGARGSGLWAWGLGLPSGAALVAVKAWPTQSFRKQGLGFKIISIPMNIIRILTTSNTINIINISPKKNRGLGLKGLPGTLFAYSLMGSTYELRGGCC